MREVALATGRSWRARLPAAPPCSRWAACGTRRPSPGCRRSRSTTRASRCRPGSTSTPPSLGRGAAVARRHGGGPGSSALRSPLAAEAGRRACRATATAGTARPGPHELNGAPMPPPDPDAVGLGRPGLERAARRSAPDEVALYGRTPDSYDSRYLGPVRARGPVGRLRARSGSAPERRPPWRRSGGSRPARSLLERDAVAPRRLARQPRHLGAEPERGDDEVARCSRDGTAKGAVAEAGAASSSRSAASMTGTRSRSPRRARSASTTSASLARDRVP